MDVDRFVELNKAWLVKFEYTDYKEAMLPSWWKGSRDYYERTCKFSLTFRPKTKYLEAYDTDFKFLMRIGTDLDKICFDNYFQDWTKPTEQEQDYLEMTEGYRLPWSEEHPFIWEEN